MEKNRIRPITNGKSMRMSYSRQKEVLQMPNLIEVQTDSYKWFLDEGLKEVFDDISPITDYSGHLSLEFVDFTLCTDETKYTIEECKERDATYAAPLKVKVRLHNKETDEDVLEAGIRIIAQPPGKKLQNMMQLSGGEKALTAISLLFAIQNLKPSPFCLLDEIEAALDDSNVTRFAQYLHKLTKNTQFIVITHRRGTMTAADRLYGITMQEKGVSTLVSVDLLEDELTK